MYGVEVGVYLADDVGSLVGLAKHCVKVYGVVRGLVSVGILADEPGDVGDASSPVSSELVVKSWSSACIVFSREPKHSWSPSMSCGTSHVYCHALPSQ